MAMPNAVPPPGNPAETFLDPGRFVDSDHPAVQGFARAHADASVTPRDIADSSPAPGERVP